MNSGPYKQPSGTDLVLLTLTGFARYLTLPGPSLLYLYGCVCVCVPLIYYLFILLLEFKPRTLCVLSLCPTISYSSNPVHNFESQFNSRDCYLPALCRPEGPARLAVAAAATPFSPAAVPVILTSHIFPQHSYFQGQSL